jgi:hypothetical protein
MNRLSRQPGSLRARLKGVQPAAALLLFCLAAGGCRANAAPAPELASETPEADPRSAQVLLKLSVTPVEADVYWGGKKLGVAGKQPLELRRPRSSGPLDLVIRAEGYLPYHTRLFTDRDDRLTVRLWRPDEATGLLGWKPPLPPAR